MKVFIGDYPDGDEERKVEIEVHPYDSWYAGHTIAMIAVPILKQLQVTKRGSPYTDDEDAPENLRSTSAKPKENEWDIDEFHHDRWGYILSEMIWALEQLVDNKEDNFSHWDKTQPAEEGSIGEMLGLGTCIIDREGLDAYNARIKRGTTLFGKYLQYCWD